MLAAGKAHVSRFRLCVHGMKAFLQSTSKANYTKKARKADRISKFLILLMKIRAGIIRFSVLTHFEQRNETNAQPILFLLDEFPRLGKISAMLDGLATLRSKKISICLIIQSLAQLDTIYGQNERKVILDTCAYKAILGVTDADTQEYFSRLCGNV